MLNFTAIQLLWIWDKVRMINITHDCIRPAIYQKAGKLMRGIIIQKPGKLDYAVPKAYRIICLPNYLRRVIEKVVTKLNTSTSEPKLHTGQFGCRY
jgi:hypothetical protein